MRGMALMKKIPTFDDLVFLPGTLTRFVIEGYREKCETKTVIGPRCENPIELDIPVYGVGAGDLVDGQLVIFHDLVGLFWQFKSKFVKRYCEAGLLMQNSLKQYASEVREGAFPAKENFYECRDEDLERLLGDTKWKYETDQGFPTNHSVTPETVTLKDDPIRDDLKKKQKKEN